MSNDLLDIPKTKQKIFYSYLNFFLLKYFPRSYCLGQLGNLRSNIRNKATDKLFYIHLFALNYKKYKFGKQNVTSTKFTQTKISLYSDYLQFFGVALWLIGSNCTESKTGNHHVSVKSTIFLYCHFGVQKKRSRNS